MWFWRRRRTRRRPYRLDPALRQLVLIRDGGRCVYCGARATEVDHVHPRVLGGRDRLDNLVASCLPCNRAKGARLLPGRSTGAKVKHYRNERRRRRRGLRVPWWFVVLLVLILAALLS